MAILVVTALVRPKLVFAQSPAERAVPERTWTQVDELPTNRVASSVAIRARKYKGLKLNHSRLRSVLAQAPDEQRQTVHSSGTILELPRPDGSMARFRVVAAPVMAPELAAKYPEIQTFLGEDIDDPTASARFDLTPAGFHAQVLSAQGTYFVDPAFRDDATLHTSYYKRDYSRAQDGFQCWYTNDTATAGRGTSGLYVGGVSPGSELARSGANLRTYRVAVAATGEYTAYQGGTVAAGLAAIVTAINRVTGVYESELAIRLVLVANNDLLVFTNASTDPYANGTPSSLLSENQTTIDNLIGNANYDLGHVFSTAGGGLAALGVVCVSGKKAQGETGTSTPVGDAFYIDYVAHEMGHQFGANHPFNGVTSNCSGANRNAATAYEPGSGSTIMAYAGICGTDDLQPHSDPYFHSISFDEILSYSTGSSGNSCAVITPTGNNPPAVSAGANYYIPQNTPFTLTASGSDPDGDPVTFCWEERDLGSAVALGTADNGASPLFRSWNPTSSPSRTFPRLAELLNNSLPLGEVMPTTTRIMNFRVTARDNRAGGGGVATADMQVNVTAGAGPFQITSHNSGGIFSGPQTITWNVAGTTAAPVNTATVNILLSTNGGLTFPITLATDTPNDGAELVVLPNLNTTSARLRVEAAGNIYFDINNANFTIIPDVPTPLIKIDAAALVAETCAPTNNAIDPDEAVTVNLTLRNIGTADVTNLVATLLVTNGVANSSGAQNYGTLLAGGGVVTRSFNLTASGVCGGNFAATLQLQDGPNDLGLVSRTFALGSLVAVTTVRSNAAAIAIPGGANTLGPAAPFPSTIAVAGVAGTVSKVTVTLRGLAHTWPADVDVLLVGPGGQNVLLMSDTGAGFSVSGLNLTFDDAAATSLPSTTKLTSGTFKPSNYTSGDTFSAPAPSEPFGSALSVFNGAEPNGTWSLYVQDDASQDVGSMAQGWQLSITTSNPVCCAGSPPVAELILQPSIPTATVNVGGEVTFDLIVSNAGPDVATGVVLTNVLPSGLGFLSASVSQGGFTNLGGGEIFQVGTLAPLSSATMTLHASALSPGSCTNEANLVSATLDPLPDNNSAAIAVVVNAYPTVTPIPDVITNEDSVAGPVAFSISDAETPADALVVSATSSDTNLVSPAQISFGGAGGDRWALISPNPNQFGTALITITISDGLAATTAAFQVTFNPVNDPPVLAPLPDYVVLEGATLVVTNQATDLETPQGQLWFSVLGAPANAWIGVHSGIFSWTPNENQGGSTNLISIVVRDDGAPSLSATQTFTVVVLESNQPPVLAPITNYTIYEGDLLTFTNVASDPDLPANLLVFALDNPPPGASVNPTNGVFTWTPDESQGGTTNLISVILTDDGSPSLSATQSFTVVVLESNSPPVLLPIPVYVIPENQNFVMTPEVWDPDAPANNLYFSLAGGPTNATIDPLSGQFSWTPNEDQGPSTNQITIVVTDDGVPSLSATQTLTIIVQEVNNPPVLAPVPDFTILEGQTLTITNSASDPDWPANHLAFGLDNGPTNAAIDATTGLFTWTPDETQGPGTYIISIVVTDDGMPALSASQAFTVQVLESNRPPVLAAIADRKMHAGTTLIFTNTASDPDVPPESLTFSLGPSAPAGATIGPNDGVFSWTPSDTNANTVQPITVLVTDDGLPPLSASRTFLVTVVARPTITALDFLTNAARISWTSLAGQSYRLQFKSNLSDTGWAGLPPDVVASGLITSVTNSLEATSRRFYRVQVVP